MTEKQIRKLVDDYFHKTLREVEEGRAFGYGIPAEEDALDDALETHDWFIHEHKKALALNKLEVIEHKVESLLKSHSIKLDKGSDEYKKLSRELLKATIEALKVDPPRLNETRPQKASQRVTGHVYESNFRGNLLGVAVHAVGRGVDVEGPPIVNLCRD